MKDFSEVWPGLQSLSFERLSSNADNFRLVDDFFNRRNDGIADTLRNEAFSEDEDGTTAYYLVKHENGRILFFFSLKCGLLYDQFLDTRQLKLISDLNAYLDTISGASDLSDDDRRLVDLIREKLIHYYADQLNFEVPEDLATAKPIYDFSCKFMCQQVKGLEDGRNTFFANFNPDEV